MALSSSLIGKWVFFGITSDNKLYVKTYDTVSSFYGTLSYDADTSTTGDTIEFGDDNSLATYPSYFDDIRVYNKVLSQSELNSVFGEIP